MRKLGRSTGARNSLLRSLATDLILNGKIVTTEEKAKELKKVVDSIISLAVKEYKNFDAVDVKVSKAKIDKDGKKVLETVESKNGKKYQRVVKEVTTIKKQKDHPSRLHARRQIMKKLHKISDVDLLDKLFNEIAPKKKANIGGYTRIVKMEPRRGDGAKMAVIEII